MKEPLILLFTRDRDFAQSVREAVSETGATALVERRAETHLNDWRELYEILLAW
jgi:hypothetical protein